MTSDADRLLAAGAPIVVAGDEVRLRFSLLALKRCEDAYGNMTGTLDELRWLADQMIAGFPVPVVDRLSTFLQAVLGTDGPVDADSTPGACIDALLDAWTASFPPVGDDAPKA